MGAIGELKQVSVATLDVLRQKPSLVKLFFAARYLPESAIWKRAAYWTGASAEQTKKECQQQFKQFRYLDNYKKENLKNQFLAEWETPELSLNKTWSELTYFLAGYIPVYPSDWSVPELKQFIAQPKQGILKTLFSNRPLAKDFLDFLVIEKSEWDGLPLVNAVGAGAEIGYATGYGPVHYLINDEIEQIANGLVQLSEQGFERRFRQEAQ